MNQNQAPAPAPAPGSRFADVAKALDEETKARQTAPASAAASETLDTAMNTTPDTVTDTPQQSAATGFKWWTTLASLAWVVVLAASVVKWLDLRGWAYPSPEDAFDREMPTNADVSAYVAYNAQIVRIFVVLAVTLTFASLSAGINWIVKTIDARK